MTAALAKTDYRLRSCSPVHETGVLVGGTLDGGSTVVSLLETRKVYSNGAIAPGTPDKISSGVFVVQGAEVGKVRNLGAVTSFGQNDMALDNWGTVERWHAHGKIKSYGPSGIGFVYLGELGEVRIDGVLETHGLGLCGFSSGEVKQGPRTGQSTRRRQTRQPCTTVQIGKQSSRGS